jgi:U6 snRNA-associated Sm-like protein LSm6
MRVQKSHLTNECIQSCTNGHARRLCLQQRRSQPGLAKKMEFAGEKAESSAAGQSKKNPTDFLKQVIGKPVIVKLNSGVTYRGVLACLDGFMNIAMEQTEEYADGQLKNRYGDCFIRGNNGNYMLVSKTACEVTYVSCRFCSFVYQRCEGEEMSSGSCISQSNSCNKCTYW